MFCIGYDKIILVYMHVIPSGGIVVGKAFVNSKQILEIKFKLNVCFLCSVL